MLPLTHPPEKRFFKLNLIQAKISVTHPPPNAPEVNTWRPPHFACNLSFMMWKLRLNMRGLMRGFLGLTVNKNELILAEEHYPGNAMKFYGFGIEGSVCDRQRGKKMEINGNSFPETITKRVVDANKLILVIAKVSIKLKTSLVREKVGTFDKQRSFLFCKLFWSFKFFFCRWSIQKKLRKHWLKHKFVILTWKSVQIV